MRRVDVRVCVIDKMTIDKSTPPARLIGQRAIRSLLPCVQRAKGERRADNPPGILARARSWPRCTEYMLYFNEIWSREEAFSPQDLLRADGSRRDTRQRVTIYRPVRFVTNVS